MKTEFSDEKQFPIISDELDEPVVLSLILISSIVRDRAGLLLPLHLLLFLHMSLESSHGGSSLLYQSGDEALRLFKGESLRWVENLLSHPLDSTFRVATIIRCLGLIEVLLDDFLGFHMYVYNCCERRREHSSRTGETRHMCKTSLLIRELPILTGTVLQESKR